MKLHMFLLFHNINSHHGYTIHYNSCKKKGGSIDILMIKFQVDMIFKKYKYIKLKNK